MAKSKPNENIKVIIIILILSISVYYISQSSNSISNNYFKIIDNNEFISSSILDEDFQYDNISINCYHKSNFILEKSSNYFNDIYISVSEDNSKINIYTYNEISKSIVYLADFKFNFTNKIDSQLSKYNLTTNDLGKIRHYYLKTEIVEETYSSYEFIVYTSIKIYYNDNITY